jgi:hypothetical protein
MISINRDKNHWELYDSATAKDVEKLNEAANKAVLDVLTFMKEDGVNMNAALNKALGTARAVFYSLSDVGAYDSEPLFHLENEVTWQFSFRS